MDRELGKNRRVLQGTLISSLKLFIIYGILLIVVEQLRFCKLPIPLPKSYWILLHCFVSIFTAFAGIGAAVNLFLWRERVALYTIYLAPALLFGGIMDILHFLTVPLMPEQLAFFNLNLESNLWFWLAGRILFALGLAMSIFFIGLKPAPQINRSSLRTIIFFAVLTILATCAIVISKLLPTLGTNQLPTITKYLFVLVPTSALVIAAGYLSIHPSEIRLFIFRDKRYHDERRSFLIGLHFLIISQLFFLPSMATEDWYSTIGHILKLLAFWYFMVSLWSAVVNSSYQYIKRFLNLSVEALVEAIDSHEPSTSGHSRRVALYAQEIGKAMRIGKEHLEQLWLAAILHDTGKISLPQNILEKHGPLTETEWVEMKKHPERGMKIVKPLELDWCEKAIFQHHERPDGKGYPVGIEGVDTIDLFARIIAIADTFDAITSHRHYRDARTPAQAKEIIIEQSGKQFDPDCVKAFEKCYPVLEDTFNHLQAH